MDAFVYFTDGTAAGTTLAKHFVAQPGDAETGQISYEFGSTQVAGNRVIFNPGNEIWASDGTAQGTAELPDLGRAYLGHQADFDSAVQTNDGNLLVPGQDGASRIF